MRLRFILFVFAVYLPSLAFAQAVDAAGIKVKVEEALKAKQSSGEALARNELEEGRRFANLSAKLLGEAREEYESIRAAESLNPALLIDYSDLLSEMGDHDLAEKVLLRAVALDRENASAWLKLGQAEAALGTKSETRAIRSLRRAAAIEPKSDATVQANASLGALYQQSGLYDFAREAYGKALDQDPAHVGSKLAIASLDAREGQMVKAKDAYDSIGSASTDYAPFITRTLGVALDDFAQSRRWLPDTAETHLAYAELLVRAGRLPDSYWPLSRAVKLDSQNFVAWNLMGSVLRAMNQLKGSREAFVKSLALNADQPRTRDAIAELDKTLAAPGDSISLEIPVEVPAGSTGTPDQPVTPPASSSAPPP
jgi:tetratricopeptide (TPR) repeat protein